MSDSPTLDDRTQEIPLAIRVDRACDVFEAEWRAGRLPRIEDAVQGIDPEEVGAFLAELIAAERELRGLRGETPEDDEYCARFPGHDQAVNLAFSSVPTGRASKGRLTSTILGGDRDSGWIALLACELGLVNRDDLAEAILAWRADAGRSLAQVLVDQGRLAPADLERLTRRAAKSPGFELGAGGDSTPLTDATAPWRDPRPDALARSGRAPSIVEVAGTMIGPYKLLQKIGEGGMGIVFLAEQERPLRRTVALKVIKPGMDTEQVVARFEAERQALAMMDHPSIARVLDAGATGSGRPYFVMELVKGVPITEYCDTVHLTPKERLELFIPVCEAVQHAHQKGIIHRDIKPSNVLVAMQDGKPVPKVIDFGIAKAVDQKLTERSLFTQHGMIVGTLEYMSPEQAQMSAMDVDTRTDVYALGVLLYELLTGTSPLERSRLRGAAYSEILRRIREEEPPKPSTRLSESREGLPSVAANRRVEPARLTKIVRGELDWIVMKALEKDRTRRYETASGFARDIRRHLDGDAVEASPPSAMYRLKKLARKHRVALTTAGVIALVLIAAATVSTVLAIKAIRAEAKTNLARASEADALKRTRSALDAMTDDVIEQFLGSQPVLTKTQKAFLGKIKRQYEGFAEARDNSPDARRDRANGLHRVAFLGERLGGSRGEADRIYRQAVSEYEGLVADYPGSKPFRRLLVRCRHDLGVYLLRAGNTKAGELVLREILDEIRKLSAADPTDHWLIDQKARICQSYGLTLNLLGRLDESEAVLVESQSAFAKLVAEAPTDVARREGLGGALQALGTLLDMRGKIEPAADALRRAIEVQAKLVAERPDVPGYRERLAFSYNGLAVVYRKQDRLEEAEQIARKALPIRASLSADFPGLPRYTASLAEAYNNLAIMIDPATGAAEIESLLRESLALHLKMATSFPENTDVLNGAAASLVNLARVALDRGDPKQAKQWLEQALPYHKNAVRLSPNNPQVRAFYRNNVARQILAFAALGDHAKSAERCEELARNAVQPIENFEAAAAGFASCSALAREDDGRPKAEREALSLAYADRAAHWLIQALEKGSTVPKVLKANPELTPILARKDVRDVILHLRRAAAEPSK
ncbi:MAG: pknB [Planctomycetota bacterium]|nr:pknB [Planctomycetota bacterium]